MKTTPVTAGDLGASVLSVPPLARNADLGLNAAANRKLIRHLAEGGVTTFMYGGNANFYNVGLYEYAALLDFLIETVPAHGWLIPSVGPDFGKMMDQVAVVKARPFPTVMVLPQTFPQTAGGVESGLKRFAEAFGRPIIVYIKADGYLAPAAVARLFEAGIVAFVKYGAVRKEPAQDPFLGELVRLVDPKLIVSGIGERPAVAHLKTYGLGGFTSGAVCVAPRTSMALLAALKRKDFAGAETLRSVFLPLEDCRDALSPIRTLHEAVTLAGIADMGPMLPLLSNLEPAHHGAVGRAARELFEYDRELALTAA